MDIGDVSSMECGSSSAQKSGKLKNGVTQDVDIEGERKNSHSWITVGRNGRPLRGAIQLEKTPKQHSGVKGGGNSYPGGIVGATFPSHVVQQRHGKRRVRIQGSLQNGSIVGAPPPRRDFFLSNKRVFSF